MNCGITMGPVGTKCVHSIWGDGHLYLPTYLHMVTKCIKYFLLEIILVLITKKYQISISLLIALEFYFKRIKHLDTKRIKTYRITLNGPNHLMEIIY